MQLKTINILPIVLALVMPAIRFYAAGEEEFAIDAPIVVVWLYSSLTLYVLWYFFWQLWEIRQGNKKWYALALLGLLFSLIALYFQLFDAGAKGAGIDISTVKVLPPVILFLTVQYALNSQRKISHLSLEKEQLQTENYKTQLQVLQAKIDPHFLFNSLNTLRSMVRQSHGGAEKFILSLSDFYRQTLRHNENTLLPLSEELAVLESYLFLMKSRNEEAVKVEVDLDKSLHDFFLPTLALQIVVENCFKHNSMTANHPLYIQIGHTKEGDIQVMNNLQPKLGEIESTGYGLGLLKKRYELLGLSQGVIVEQSADQFRVTLKLIK